MSAFLFRVHVYIDVGGRAGKIHKTKATMAVYDFGNLMVRCKNASDIRTRGNGSYFCFAFFILFKQGFKV